MYYAFDRRWLNSTVTVTLVAVNILVFAVTSFLGRGLYAAGVLDVYRVVYGGEYNRLVSAMFLHADFSHLFSNMLLLFYIGGLVEKNLGAVSYALLYFASGIAGNAATLFIEVLQRESWTSVGASGAVFGVMGAMLALLFSVREQLEGRSSLLYRVGFMVAYSLYSGLRSRGVNNIAHIAGLLCGVLLCFCFLRLSGKRPDVRTLL